MAATTVPEARGTQRFLIASLMFIALVSAFILSAYTPHGRAFPEAGGYGTAAWAGVAVMAVTLTVIAGLALAQRRPEIGRKPGRPTGYAPGASRS